MVGNAIKYSHPNTEVKVTVFVAATRNITERRIVIDVSDNGPGIPPEEQDLIFTPFNRGNSVNDVPSNGLGLSISKKIADSLGWSLSLDKTYTLGCRFVLEMQVNWFSEIPKPVIAKNRKARKILHNSMIMPMVPIFEREEEQNDSSPSAKSEKEIDEEVHPNQND